MADQQPADRLAEIRALLDTESMGLLDPGEFGRHAYSDMRWLLAEVDRLRAELAHRKERHRTWLLRYRDARAEVDRERASRQDWAAEALRLDAEAATLRTDRTRLILTATDSTGSTVDEAEAAITRARDVQDSMGAESWAQMRRERDQARARLDAVLALHPDRGDGGQCDGCLDVDPGGYAPTPCPTRRAALGDTEMEVDQ